jgi:hypothetical protein
MDSYELPDAIEPNYWNVVFHPSENALARWCLGRFGHVSAFAYVPGVGVWIVYDCQWGGTRISFVPRVKILIAYTRGCAVVKMDRLYKPMILMSRIGFYCVPAIKNLLGLSCVAVTADGLYRHLLDHGGTLINGESVKPAAAAARSDAATGAAAGAG